MISYLRGTVAAFEEDKVIVDVGGVGYGVYMSGQAMGKLPAVGREVKLHTYLNVKEDAMQLYGFLTRDDLTVFKLLIGVNGIGPKGGSVKPRRSSVRSSGRRCEGDLCGAGDREEDG